MQEKHYNFGIATFYSQKKFQKKLESFIFATHLNLKLKNEKWHRLHQFLKGQEIIHRKLW